MSLKRCFVIVFILGTFLTLFPDNLAASTQPSAKVVEFQRALASKNLRPAHFVQKQIAPAFQKSVTANTPVLLQGFGSISGYVGGLDSNALSTAYVEAWTADSTATVWSKGLAIVNADFTYRIDSLAAGKYFVCAWADGYQLEYYPDADDFKRAIPVEVVDGQVTRNIDFKMEQIVRGTGCIRGRVLDAETQQPLTESIVSAYSPVNPMLYGWAQTDRAGYYQITDLKSGDYQVTAWSEGYLPEYYNEVLEPERATLIRVTEPDTISKIDFHLIRGSEISGRVTTREGLPLVGVYLEAVTLIADSTGPGFGYQGQGKAMTDEAGNYLINGLPAGTYYIRADYWAEWLYVSRWYPDAASPESATPLILAAKAQLTGIDFQLPLTVQSGRIQGRVVNSEGQGIENACIQVQSRTDSTNWASFWAYAYTDGNGDYVVNRLPYGQYYVSAWAQSGWQSTYRWWPNTANFEDAQPVVVDENQPATPINFQLPLQFGKAVISGVVKAQDGHPLSGVGIQLTTAKEPDPNDPLANYFWAYGNTDSTGRYYIKGLVAGEYVAMASYWENDKFGQQWYDHADSLPAATTIRLQADEVRADIHFDLTLKPMYGEIVGVVTDSLTGLPINRAYVEIKPVYPEWRSFRPWFGNYHTLTDESGQFKADWLWAGKYQVMIYANGSLEYFENAQTPASAKTLTVVGGETTELNFQLVPRVNGPGQITGCVLNEWEKTPFEIAVVIAIPATAVTNGQIETNQYVAVTDKAGHYALTGLPVGEFYVKSFAPYTVEEYFQEVFDPGEATVVKVDGSSPTANIDFTLSMIRYYKFEDSRNLSSLNSIIRGTVVNLDQQPVAEATIYVLNNQQQAVNSVHTDAEGAYQITGLPPGDYWLKAGKLGYRSVFNGNVANLAEAVPVNLNTNAIEVNFVLPIKGTTTVPPQTGGQLPQTVALMGAYPNPFNPETTIRFALPMTMPIKLRIFNILGNEIATLVDGALNAGYHSVRWQGSQLDGTPAASGMYLIRLETPQGQQMGKMLLMR